MSYLQHQGSSTAVEQLTLSTAGAVRRPLCFLVFDPVLFCYLRCVHVDHPARHGVSVESLLASTAEGDDAVNDGEDRVISARFDVLARHDLCAALSHDDFTRLHGRAVGTFNTQIFRI